MKVLEEYDSIDEAIVDYLKDVDEMDYPEPMFKELDKFNTAGFIIGSMGFESYMDGDRMRNTYEKPGAPFHAVAPNVAIPWILFESDTMNVAKESDMVKYFSEDEMDLFRRYKEYFNLEWDTK